MVRWTKTGLGFERAQGSEGDFVVEWLLLISKVRASIPISFSVRTLIDQLYFSGDVSKFSKRLVTKLKSGAMPLMAEKSHVKLLLFLYIAFVLTARLTLWESSLDKYYLTYLIIAQTAPGVAKRSPYLPSSPVVARN